MPCTTRLHAGPSSLERLRVSQLRPGPRASAALTVKQLDAHTLVVRHVTSSHPLDFNEYTFTR
jgi:hypothetical protein